MSTKPIHQALKALLPSTTAIPPRLASAAESLLSVSRQRASNLKPDEEIARAHVCAELACNRLRAHLRLPNIKSGNGAPCRPALYKRLLTFLEGALKDVELIGTPQKPKNGQKTPTTAGKSTGRKRTIEALSEDDLENLVETPTKKKKGSGQPPSATSTKSTGKKTNGFLGRIHASTGKGQANVGDTEAPDFVLPTVRKLCQAFKTPKLVPHVYTGVCVCISLADLHPMPGSVSHSGDIEGAETQEIKVQLLCLVLAVFAVTLTRMHEGDMTQDVFDAVSARSLKLVGLNSEDESTKAQVEEWIGSVTTWTADTESAASWIDSIPLNNLAPFKLPKPASSSDHEVQSEDGPIEVDEVEDDHTPSSRHHRGRVLTRKEEIMKELEKEDPDDVLLPGLGTMVNDAVDYLSEERRTEYAEWKAHILRQIEVVEKGGGGKRTKAMVAAS